MQPIAKNEFVPKKKEHCTHVYHGIGVHIKDLPVTNYNGTMVSIWALPSLWQRVKFLFKNEITLKIMGSNLPPMILINGDIIGKKNNENL